MHPLTWCHFETKFSGYNTFWTPKIQLLQIWHSTLHSITAFVLQLCSFVLLNLFSLISHRFTLWAKNLPFTWKKKRGGDNSRTSPWIWLFMVINLCFFFFNDPRYKDILGITINMLCPGKSYSKTYGTEPRYNNLRYNNIPVITMSFYPPSVKSYCSSLI